MIAASSSVLVAAAAGCGGGDQAATAPVVGRVTLNGEPVTHGYVFAKPSDGRSAVGKIRPDGSFAMGTYGDEDGALIGTHTLTLSPPRPHEGPLPSDAVVPPSKYGSASSSGLTLTVPPAGVDGHEIALTASEREIQASRVAPGFVE